MHDLRTQERKTSFEPCWKGLGKNKPTDTSNFSLQNCKEIGICSLDHSMNPNYLCYFSVSPSTQFPILSIRGHKHSQRLLLPLDFTANIIKQNLKFNPCEKLVRSSLIFKNCSSETFCPLFQSIIEEGVDQSSSKVASPLGPVFVKSWQEMEYL